MTVSVVGPLAACRRQGEWGQVAAGWDQAAGRLALYCDGRPIAVAQRRWNAGPPPSRPLESQRLVIGNLGDGEPDSRHGLDGELDEVRLYARALSADEIGALYRNFAGSR